MGTRRKRNHPRKNVAEIVVGGMRPGKRAMTASVCGTGAIEKKMKKDAGNTVVKNYRKNRKRYTLTLRSLSADYQNPYKVMLHSVFQILVDFVEKEKPWNYINWESDEGHKKASDTFKKAYAYWKKERPVLVKNYKKTVSASVKNFDFRVMTFTTKSDRKLVALSVRQEKFIDDQDKKHMMALLDVRKYMWT
ncbi:MAG: hypothetical protein WC511_02150 [Candidatus Pacearchaeota archaeon]